MGKINMKIHPNEDGITHINMYSKARTPFGKMLSDFYHFRINTPEGKFESVEAYWYYLSLPESVNRDKIRKCYGWFAKKTGRELRKEAGEENLIFDPDFEDKILTAIEQKVRANINLIRPEYKGLPVIHYYILGDGKPYDVTNDFPWLIEGINNIVKDVYKEIEINNDNHKEINTDNERI